MPRRPRRFDEIVEPTPEIGITVPASSLDETPFPGFGNNSVAVEQYVPKPAPPKLVIKPAPTPTQVRESVKVARLKTEVNVITRLWEVTDPSHRSSLRPSLMSLYYRVRAIALKAGGYGKDSGNSFAILQAKTLFCTGKEYDRSKSCIEITKSGTPCKNKPMIGIDRCQVPTHASQEEREYSRSITKGWSDHFTSLIVQVGLSKEYEALATIINHKEEK